MVAGAGKWSGFCTLLGAGMLMLSGLGAGCTGIISPAEGTADPVSGDCAAEQFLASTCASNGACHVPGGQSPTLFGDALSRLSSLTATGTGNRLLVPGRPDESWLYIKMAGLQGAAGGAPMPLGSRGAEAGDLKLVYDWIADGALRCNDVVVSAVDPDPNTLNQDSLFVCSDPNAPRSSPARLRRVHHREFTRAVGRRLNPTWWGSVTRDNPLYPSPKDPFSSYPSDLSLDMATFDILGFVMDEATEPWTGYSSTARLQGLYSSNGSVKCMFDDASPSGSCIDSYTEFLLRRGALFRTPTAGEKGRLEALLRSELAEEQATGGTRRDTLRTVAEAAFRMTGAMFRTESGPATLDGTPRPLNPDELALALGRVLSDFPVGSLFESTAIPATHPDAADRSRGRFGKILAAAEDGSLFDPTVRAGLLRHYYGGRVSAPQDRPDFDQGTTNSRVGEYWLADGILQFFREWLDYERAVTEFKDSPTRTSQFPVDHPLWGRHTLAFSGRAQNQRNMKGENSLVGQLDDTIARVVVESDLSGTNTLEILLTTNRWHVPSNLVQASNVRCSQASDCPSSACSGRSCACSSGGYCIVDFEISSTMVNEVHNITVDIPETPAGRWHDLPASERLGVLTHPAWLGAHGDAFEDGPSAVHRGKWIRENLFCESVPPLSSVMVEAQLIPSSPSLRARDRLLQSTTQGPNATVCAGCHSLMNPLGLAFETFNHAGYLRVTDHGAGVDGSTVLTNLPDPALNASYNTPQEMLRAFSTSPYVQRCFIRQVFRYFVGRDEGPEDSCTLSEMEAAYAQRGSFVDMLEALVMSDTFSHRSVTGVAP